MKDYYSISDLLNLKLPNLPSTRRGWEKYVVSNELKYREVPSRGKGGVRKEYALSDDLQILVNTKIVKHDVMSSESLPADLNIQNSLTQAKLKKKLLHTNLLLCVI